MNYSGLLHELNSPIASLQAILFTNKQHLSPELHQKLSHHLSRLIQATTVLSEILASDEPSPDHLTRLLTIWLQLHQTPLQGFTMTPKGSQAVMTHPITGPTTKIEYADLIWTMCRRQAKQLGGTLRKSKKDLTLSLPVRLQP